MLLQFELPLKTSLARIIRHNIHYRLVLEGTLVDSWIFSVWYNVWKCHLIFNPFYWVVEFQLVYSIFDLHLKLEQRIDLKKRQRIKFWELNQKWGSRCKRLLTSTEHHYTYSWNVSQNLHVTSQYRIYNIHCMKTGKDDVKLHYLQKKRQKYYYSFWS